MQCNVWLLVNDVDDTFAAPKIKTNAQRKKNGIFVLRVNDARKQEIKQNENAHRIFLSLCPFHFLVWFVKVLK